MSSAYFSNSLWIEAEEVILNHQINASRLNEAKPATGEPTIRFALVLGLSTWA